MNEPLSKIEKKLLKAQIRAEKEKQESNDLSNNYKDTITILCVRFGTLYGRQYVERLRNMVSRNITVPYRFCCLTDDHHSIQGVETIYQPNAGYRKGWWHKVHMFDPSLNLGNRILYFDLDVIVHDNIDKLIVSYKNEFVGIRDFNRKFHPSWQYLNSSVMSWTHGSHTKIWEDYMKDISSAQKLHGDQDWIWRLGKNEIKFWPEEWIRSYKWETRSRSDLTMIGGKRKFKVADHNIRPDPRCCVSVFHGDPKPQDVQDKFVLDHWK
jgi:hypothetical protein